MGRFPKGVFERGQNNYNYHSMSTSHGSTVLSPFFMKLISPTPCCTNPYPHFTV